MKKIRNSIVSFSIVLVTIFGVISCEEENTAISATITDFSPEILRGDSATVSINIIGGTAPYAFRYKYLNADGEYLFRNVIDIPSNEFTLKTAPTADITYEAVSIASYGLVGDATGIAPVVVAPVTYRFAESIPTSKAAFMQKSRNELTYTSNLQLRTTGNNFERIVFFEFDISQFTEIKDKSRYNLKFWLVGSHSVGLNKPSTMNVKAIVGELDSAMTWDSQPATVDLTPLFTKDFETTDTADQIEFEGNIDTIVYPAIASGATKITFVVRELVNDVGNGGYYFIGSDTYADEDKRPMIDMFTREKL